MAGQLGCLTIILLLISSLWLTLPVVLCQQHCAVLVPPLLWWWFVTVQIGHLDFCWSPFVTVHG